MSQQQDRIRIDKWLWAARFFKTRPLATEAVKGGRVHINDQRVKAAAAVRIGDILRISRGTDVMIVTVVALSDKRGPASTAQLLYQESDESRAARQKAREQRRELMASMPAPVKRPDKKQRRHIIRFQRKSNSS